MRKFALHTYDRAKTFDLNNISALAAEPTGLGNAFKTAYKESEKGKHLTNVTPSFEPITLKVYFNADGTDGYANYKSLLLFLAECGTSAFLFEYNDGVTDKFCDVVLKSAPKSEITEDGLFCETFTFERQTYWYEKIETSFDFRMSADESTYPLTFPFSFIGTSFSNSIRVKNIFFENAPIIIKARGYIESNIRVFIRSIDTNEIVSEIQLSRGNADGETIVIDPTTKKITVTDEDGNVSNGYGLTDKTKQSFLYLPQGEYYVGANITAKDSGSIEVSIKRYLLD